MAQFARYFCPIPLGILSALFGLKHLVLFNCETLFSSVVFVLGGKPEKNPLAIRTNNKLNPGMTGIIAFDNASIGGFSSWRVNYNFVSLKTFE